MISFIRFLLSFSCDWEDICLSNTIYTLCLNTFPKSSKFAKNTPPRVVFELSSQFGNVIKHCLSSLTYYLQQFRSSLRSPQSLSPSHFHSVRTHRWLSQVNSVGRQVGCVQFACSSEPSPQSSSRSQTNRFGIHRVLLQENLSPQPFGKVVAANQISGIVVFKYNRLI